MYVALTFSEVPSYISNGQAMSGCARIVALATSADMHLLYSLLAQPHYHCVTFLLGSEHFDSFDESVIFRGLDHRYPDRLQES